MQVLNYSKYFEVKQIAQKLLISLLIFLPLFLDFYFLENNRSFLLFLIYSLSFLILLNFISKWILLIELPALFLSSLITPYLVLTKTKLSHNVIASIYDTDYNESLELISSPFIIKYFLLSIIVLTLPIIFKKFADSFLKREIFIKIRLMFLMVPLLILCIIYNYNSVNTRTTSYQSSLLNYYPFRQIIFVKNSLDENINRIQQYRNMKFKDEIFQDRNNDVSVLLIVGEAVRKSTLNIYGNKHLTTPYMTFLKNNYPQKITFFSNMVTIAPFTRVAVPSLFSMSNALNYNQSSLLPSVFKIINHAGIKTAYVSIRNRNSYHESFSNELVKDNEIIERIDGKYDEDLLDVVNKNINKKKKQLLTVHLSGSHYNYKDRYPPDFNCFVPDNYEANYFSSIRYTDFVLSKIIREMDKNGKPCVLIYTSDHGEYLNDDGDNIYGHGFKKITRNEIDIPLIFIYNNEFVKKYNDVINLIKIRRDDNVSLDNISHTILGLIGVSDLNYYSEKYDISSEKFMKHPRYLIDRSLNVLNIKDVKFENNSKKSNIKIKNICENYLEE